MTQAELYTELQILGLPVAYGEFISTTENPAPSPPFICYQFTFSEDLMADDVNSEERSNYDIELYTNKKDPLIEKLVQDKLRALGIPYRKIETWIESEKMHQVVYEIQLTGG